MQIITQIMVTIIGDGADHHINARDMAGALKPARQGGPITEIDKFAIRKGAGSAAGLNDHSRAHHVPRGWKAVAFFESDYGFTAPNGPLTDTADRGVKNVSMTHGKSSQ